MDKSLSLLVKFAALDKLTGPMRNILGTSKKTSEGLAKTRKEIDALKQAQSKIGAFRGIETKLKAESAAMEAARTKIAALKTAIEKADGSTKGLARSLAAAEKAEARATTRHEAQGQALQALSRKLDASGIDVADLARHEDRLAHKVHDATGKLKAQQAELERTAKARARMEKVSAAGGQLRSGGVAAVGAGAATLGALALPVKSAAEFESQLTDIGQKIGINRAEAAKLGRIFDEMGPKIGQLPTKLAEGVDTLAGFGLKGDEAVRMVEPIGRAATAYKAEVSDLAASTYASIDNLKVPVASTAKTLDIMAAAGKAGAFELKDMAQYFPALTASAQALGQKGVGTVADLASALQITRKGAGDSAQAANNLQNLLTKINTEDTIKNFKEFGVDLPAAMKKAAKDGKSPIEAIAELSNKALGGDLSKMSFLFGDAQVQAALRPLITNLDEFRKIREKALGADGTVGSDFADRMKDTAAQGNRLRAITQSLGHQMGATLLPAVAAVTGKVASLAERFAAWSQRNPQTAATLLKIVTIAALLVIGLGALSMTIGGLMWVFGPLIGILIRFGPTLLRLLAPIKMLGTAIIWLAKGVFRAGLMMMANPMVAAIVLIVAAVALLGYAIYSNWDKIKATFAAGVAMVAQRWAAFKAMFSAGLAFVVGLGTRFMSAGRNLISGLINGFMGRIGELKSKIVGLATSVTGWFKGALGIHSPSRVFAGLGGYVTQGLALGIGRGGDEPVQRIQNVARRMTQALAVGAAAPAIAMSGGGTSGAAASARMAIAPSGPITIQIYAAPGQSERSIAEEVRKALEMHQRGKAAAARSSYDDDA